jgi:hypothetical protein
VFATTLNVTVPAPEPLAPEVIVTQGELDMAVQAQPGAADTPIIAVPPLVGTV